MAHRGRSRYLLRSPGGSVINRLDHLSTPEECRAEIEVEKMLEARTVRDGISPLERVHATRREWLRWSVERLEEKSAQVLDLGEPGPVEELSQDQILQLIAEWEPIYAGEEVRTKRS